MKNDKAAPAYNAVTIRYEGLTSRIISEVKVFPGFDPAEFPQVPDRVFEGRALWDTGATNSLITSAVVAQLGLVATGRVNVSHAAGISEANTYVVSLMLQNNVLVGGITAVETHDGVGDFGVIIGMDIITLGDFSITNLGGKTWMTFRQPSRSHVDYVDEYNREWFSGTNRNAPCPCGSGKKYKECHGGPRSGR